MGGCGRRGSPLLEFMLVREVVADDATRRSAQKGMVMGEVTRHPAHHGALDAAFGAGRPSPRDQGKG
jgi:hypothetical protein